MHLPLYLRIRWHNIINSELIAILSIISLILSTIILGLSSTKADSDLWGHLQFGLDTIRTGSINRVDTYSYLTTGQLWINHEWLSEVFFAFAWKLGGVLGLNIFKLLVGLSVIVILYRYLLLQSMDSILAAAFLWLGFYLQYISFITIRPQVFTILLFTLVILILTKAESKQYRWLWCLPVIFALWINFHGGFLAGVGIIGLWTILHFFQNQKNWKKFLPPVTISILATLVNPYGPLLLIFLAKTAFVPRPEITEWQSIHLVSIIGILYLVMLGICVTGFIFAKVERRPVLIIVFTSLSILPLVAVRFVSLFAVGAAVIAGPYLSNIKLQRRPFKNNQLITPFRLLGIAIPINIILIYTAFLHLGTIVFMQEAQYPVNAVTILKQSGVTGNIANEFIWGEYLIWHVGDRLKVSVDGRRETVYPNETYQQNINFMKGVGEWDALIRNYDTQIVLVYRSSIVYNHPSSAAYNLLKLTPNWVLIYQDDSSALFARKDFKGFQQLQETAATFQPPSETGLFP